MKKFTIDGSTLSMSEWARRAGVSRQAMASRVRKATTKAELKEALTSPASQGARTDLKKQRR